MPKRPGVRARWPAARCPAATAGAGASVEHSSDPWTWWIVKTECMHIHNTHIIQSFRVQQRG